MKDDLITIGELARLMNVSVRTLQYYDREELLKPSAFSDGGRRLYSPKDIVKLHQILSFKYLGFSLEEIKNRILPLDKPEEVANILMQQRRSIEEQMENLQKALQAVDALHTEVLNIQKVDFKKYAEIIELLRMGNKEYWVWKHFDEDLTNHIKKRFAGNPALGLEILETYTSILDEAVLLKRRGESPGSEESMALASKWWNMIMEFTGGDLKLLPKLMEFNSNKNDWKEETAEKQQEADDYIGEALSLYFKNNGIIIPGMEQPDE